MSLHDLRLRMQNHREKLESHTKRQAFTLMELLVTITIITVILILGFMGAEAVLDSARTTACAANMRSVGMAHLAFRSDHNNQFVGFPAGSGVANSSGGLVPNYLGEWPICPSAKRKMTAADVKTSGTAKRWFQKSGGVYALNKVLAQWPLEGLPPPGLQWYTFRPSKTPLILETRSHGGNLHAESQLNDTLKGDDTIAPRYHGSKRDGLNFMFVDGHIELIRRNDNRDIPDANKRWARSSASEGNPQGAFTHSDSGTKGEFFLVPKGLSDNFMKEHYGTKSQEN